ncbi:myo-inosose-2 dehydratase [Actinoplanes regularis]|uniref:Inosose dehydratase n=1 Tax=Actinoplanes regularis TaxID=52697 RepID=A0A238Z488_9ACTN|nr:myo-inosose-2 dehydratase [Actinoplanes regularis]GIE85811.1 myo-inosose-2 dehydratase [Actinoplanes regularis]SNR78140.1 inosose dehydratase [Actinoplanes regularis]
MSFPAGAVSVGITPTCWTNDDFPGIGEDISFEQCISEMALAGYEGCSVGHKFPKDPTELRDALALRGLRVTEPWSSTYFTVEGMHERTVAAFRDQMSFIQAAGGDRIVVAELGHAVHQQPVALLANRPIFDDARWNRMVAGLHELGKLAADAGMMLCYHHHMGTGVQTRQDVDRLLADTDPGLVHLLLDTGHLTWAGDDPLALARAYAGRIAHVHLKDLRAEVLAEWRRTDSSFHDAVLAGIFTVPGDGMIDFKSVLGALADGGYRGWLVVEAEQDPRRAHPLASAKRAREYLRATARI